jgi:hypothetical protein
MMRSLENTVAHLRRYVEGQHRMIASFDRMLSWRSRFELLDDGAAVPGDGEHPLTRTDTPPQGDSPTVCSPVRDNG